MPTRLQQIIPQTILTDQATKQTKHAIAWKEIEDVKTQTILNESIVLAKKKLFQNKSKKNNCMSITNRQKNCLFVQERVIEGT